MKNIYKNEKYKFGERRLATASIRQSFSFKETLSFILLEV